MADSDPGTAAGPDATASVLACEFPGGCPNTVDYAGVGRKPRYCGLAVDGVAHTRYNAHRVNQGALTLPAPGSRPAASAADPPAPRPVSLARASIEALRDEIAQTVTAHQHAMRDLSARITDTLAAATDPDAAAAEVAAAHREARAQIDTAEAAEADARARARAAEATATAAHAEKAQAEQAAEDALAERDDAVEERNRYVGLLADRDAELDTTRGRLDETELAHRQTAAERDQLTEQLAQSHTERDRVTGELAQLSAAHDTLRAQHQQAQAERDTARTELAAAHARADEHAQAAAEARTAQAVTTAEHAALARQLERDVAGERAHGEQRLTDLSARHDEQTAALRAQLAEQRDSYEAQLLAAHTGPGLGNEEDTGEHAQTTQPPGPAEPDSSTPPRQPRRRARGPGHDRSREETPR